MFPNFRMTKEGLRPWFTNKHKANSSVLFGACRSQWKNTIEEHQPVTRHIVASSEYILVTEANKPHMNDHLFKSLNMQWDSCVHRSLKIKHILQIKSLQKKSKKQGVQVKYVWDGIHCVSAMMMSPSKRFCLQNAVTRGEIVVTLWGMTNGQHAAFFSSSSCAPPLLLPIILRPACPYSSLFRSQGSYVWHEFQFSQMIINHHHGNIFYNHRCNNCCLYQYIFVCLWLLVSNM